MYKILVSIVAMIVMTSIAFAADAQDPTSIDVGSNANWAPTATTGQLATANGGNITSLNATATAQTQRWQLYYGDIFRNFVLQDGTQTAFSWAGSDDVSNGYIFFANSNAFSFGGLATGATDLANENTALAMGSSVDNMTQTFNRTSSAAVNVGSVTLGAGAVPVTATLDGVDAEAWETGLVNDGAGNEAYVGWLGDSVQAYNTVEADYQVMVPTANAGTRNYYVYVVME